MVGVPMRRTGTFIGFEQEDLANSRLANSSDWRKYNAGDKSNRIGMGPDGNFYVLTPRPETGTDTGSRQGLSDAVKIAEPSIVKAVQEKAYSNEKVLESLFEDFGLQEILSVTRNSSMNIVNGQNVLYQPISNVASLYLQYNPMNILPLQSADTIFKNFSIALEDKIVEDGDGTGTGGASEYLDEQNNLVIEVTNMEADEMVEIESLSIESPFNDTIYTGEPS